MTVFKHKSFSNHEQLLFFNDDKADIRGIIAIHNTNLGPTLGGCRFVEYTNDNEALDDVLRLSKGMTYKAAVANLPLGGGKSVIIKNKGQKDLTEEQLQVFAKAINSLNGMYYVAEDMGTSVEIMKRLSKYTKFVTGLDMNMGGSGDPSPVTAYGVFCGIKAAVEYKLRKKDLNGLTFAIQGVGNVGYNLCRLLHNAGAKLIVTDINQNALNKAQEEFDAKIVGLDEIYDVDCDVFSPNSIGGTVNENTIHRIKAEIIAGSANNQLRNVKTDGELLKQLDKLYAPDYVINMGGLISVHEDLLEREYSREAALKSAEYAYDCLLEIFSIAKTKNIPTSEAADSYAEAKFLGGTAGQMADCA